MSITIGKHGDVTMEIDGNIGVIKPETWVQPSEYGSHWLCTKCGHHWDADEIGDCPECGNTATDGNREAASPEGEPDHANRTLDA